MINNNVARKSAGKHDRAQLSRVSISLLKLNTYIFMPNALRINFVYNVGDRKTDKRIYIYMYV